jgi:beta-lactam-binding protein with PASTA domain
MLASATGTNFSEADVIVNANTLTNSSSFTAIAAAGGIVEPSISAGTAVNRLVDSDRRRQRG